MGFFDALTRRPARDDRRKPGRNPGPRARKDPRNTFTMKVDDRTLKFDISAPVCRRFFIPRYEDGSIHEPGATQFMLQRLAPGATMLDVGANLGYFSMVAAGVAGSVYAVEAQEKMAATVRANADLNGLTNVHPICAAAGDETGFVVMPDAGLPRTSVGQEGTYQVPVIRLDDYFSGETAPDFVKIDVEGFELNVLRGARKLLERGPPLMIELHIAMEKFGATPAEIHALLTEHGYAVRAGSHRSPHLSLNDVGHERLAKNLNNRMIFCERPA